MLSLPKTTFKMMMWLPNKQITALIKTKAICKSVLCAKVPWDNTPSTAAPVTNAFLNLTITVSGSTTAWANSITKNTLY